MKFCSKDLLIPFSFLSVIFLTQHSFIKAQSNYEPLNHHIKSFNDGGGHVEVEDENSELNTTVYPLNSFGVKAEMRLFPYRDSRDEFMVNRKFSEFSWFRRKLLYENFIIIDTGIFYVAIDPLLNLSVGMEQEGGNEAENYYTNTRGLRLQGDIGKKLSFESYFYENQSTFPRYINDFVVLTEVVPGQGRVKSFKEDAFDYAQSGGYFSYVPFEEFSIQFGHHKHFIGDGYRSVILSDNSFNYPFLRMNARFMNKKFGYTVLYALHQDLVRTPTNAPSEAPFRRKGATYHVLEYQVNSQLKFNVFQGTIFPFEDSSGTIDRDASMLNPVIFVNPILNGMDYKFNSILGFGFKFWPMESTATYGQFAIDDAELKQYSYQLGLRQFLLNKKLYFQLEFNYIARDMYESTRLDFDNSFVHYNQPLANVLGNNSEEIVFRTAYRLKRFMPSFQINYSNQKNFERNVFWANGELAYILNPATNLKIYASYTRRTEIPYYEGGVDISSDIIYFGIRTDLRNIYYDF